MDRFKEKICAYFQKNEDIVAIYLFGSQAKGKSRPFSDVDIGIVLQYQALDKASALKEKVLVELGRQLRKDIHAVILNSAGELLLKQVFKNGVCVCVNDEVTFKQFKMIRYSMISDFGDYLKLAQHGFHRKVMEEHPIG